MFAPVMESLPAVSPSASQYISAAGSLRPAGQIDWIWIRAGNCLPSDEAHIGAEQSHQRGPELLPLRVDRLNLIIARRRIRLLRAVHEVDALHPAVRLVHVIDEVI